MNTIFQKTVELRHICYLVLQRRRLEQYLTQFPNFLKFFNQEFNLTAQESFLVMYYHCQIFFFIPIILLSMFLSHFSLLYSLGLLLPQHIPQTSQWHLWYWFIYLISKLQTHFLFLLCNNNYLKLPFKFFWSWV